MRPTRSPKALFQKNGHPKTTFERPAEYSWRSHVDHSIPHAMLVFGREAMTIPKGHNFHHSIIPTNPKTGYGYPYTAAGFFRDAPPVNQSIWQPIRACNSLTAAASARDATPARHGTRP